MRPPSGWSSYGLLAEAGTEESLGINYSSPGEIDLSSGNAFTMFGGQLAMGGGGGGPAQAIGPSSSSVTEPPNGKKWWPSTNTSSCTVYPPGSLPGRVCNLAGNSPQANSIRGCLQQFYVPSSGYFPLLSMMPTVAPVPNLSFLEGLDTRVGFGEHAYCLPEGFLNP